MDRASDGFSVVIAIRDPVRPASRAPEMAGRLTAHSATRLEVMTIAASGDRTNHLVDQLAHRDGALVVLDAHGGGFPGDKLFDEDAEAVLAHVSTPTLVIGPGSGTLDADTLVVVGDDSTPFGRPLDVVARWAASFATPAVDVITLEAPNSWPDPAPALDGALSEQLATRQLAAAMHHLTTLDPSDTICDAAATYLHPVIVVTAPRLPGPDHWFSTARRVIRRANCPILVVPAVGR